MRQDNFASAARGVALAAIVAASIAVPRPLMAERWRDWVWVDDATVDASMSPWLDTRQRDFNRGYCGGYASLYGMLPHPGEIVLERTGASHLPDGPLTLRVEVVPVPEDKAGAPSIPANAHYAENPFLPFGPPPGRAAAPVFTSETVFPMGAAFPLRAHFQMPDYVMTFMHDRDKTLLRVRWSVTDDAGNTLGRGVIPDAFSPTPYNWGRGEASTIYACSPQSAKDGKTCSQDPLFATTNLPMAWPAIADTAEEILFDAPFIDACFATAGDFAAFARRAALLDVAVRLDESGGAPKILEAVESAVARRPPLVVPSVAKAYHHGYVTGKQSLSAGGVDVACGPRWRYSGRYSGSDDAQKPYKDHQARDEELLEKARIPGATLGRDQRWYVAVTVLFMLAFAVGTGVLLVRHFAFRRGEARLAVWRALPVWCVASAVFALIVVRPLLDRSPRADVTEWRYSVCGMPEEIRIDVGRAQSFLKSPADWTFPSDGWFGPASMKRRCAVRADIAAGTQTLAGAPRVVGDLEEVCTMRFAPRDGSPVSVSPDKSPRPETPADFKKALSGWLFISLDRPAPKREVTANRDFDAVWVYAGRQWYSLGPMGKGETVALDASRRVWQGMDLVGKPYANLFANAPLAMRTAAVVSEAERWMAKANEPDGEGPPPIDEGLLRRLGEVVVFALRRAGADAPDLVPVFNGGRRPVVTSRTVEVEVFQ